MAGITLPLVNDTNAPEKVNILVYGQPGTGKTTLLSTGEPRFKTLIVDAEGGLLSLKRRELALSGQVGKPFKFDNVRVRTIEDLVLVRDFLYNEKHDYKLVCLDSGTELQKVLIDAILKEKSRTELVQKDWGTLLNKMVGVIRSFRDLPNVSFVLTALSEEIKNEATGETSIVPAFDGKIKQTIDGYFDEVFYAYTQEKSDDKGVKRVEHKLLTRNNGRIRGKDRSGKLPLVVDPDFCAIYDSIYTTKKEEKVDEKK